MSLLASVSRNLKFWEFGEESLELSSSADFFLQEMTPLSPSSSVPEAAELFSVAWNHNQQVIAVGGTGQKLHLVQANTGKTLSSLPINEKDNFVGNIRSLSFSHNSRYLASAIEKEVAVWDLKKRNIRVRLSGHKAVVKALQFSNEGTILSGDTSGAMIMWNVDENSRSKEILNPGYRSPLHCLKLSPSNHRHVCCGYGDGSVTVWDTQTLTSLSHCTTAHESAVTSIAYSPKNDRLIATGGKDGKICLVDLGSRHDKYSPAVSLNIGEKITSLSFHESALYTGVGTEDGYIYIYDWRNSRKPVVQCAAHNPMPVNELVFQQTPPAKVSSKKDSKRLSSTSSATSAVSSSSGRTMDTVSTLETSSQLPPVPPSSVNSKSTHSVVPPPSVSSKTTPSLTPPPTVNPTKESSSRVDPISSTTTFSPNPTKFQEPHQIPPTASSISSKGPSVQSHTPQQSHSKTPIQQTPVSSQPPVGKNVERDDVASLSSRVSASVSTPIAHEYHTSQNVPLDDSSYTVESQIRNQMRPVTNQQMTEALQLIQYDVHREVQSVIREQVRQFSIAKEETGLMISQLSEQLREVMQANKELRSENERLRRIY